VGVLKCKLLILTSDARCTNETYIYVLEIAYPVGN
jgi:hypothetical protein